MVRFGTAYAALYQECIDVLLAQRADRTADVFFRIVDPVTRFCSG